MQSHAICQLCKLGQHGAMEMRRALMVTLGLAAVLTAGWVWIDARAGLSDAPGLFIWMLVPGWLASRLAARAGRAD